jgi:hypothetical protein
MATSQNPNRSRRRRLGDRSATGAATPDPATGPAGGLNTVAVHENGAPPRSGSPRGVRNDSARGRMIGRRERSVTARAAQRSRWRSIFDRVTVHPGPPRPAPRRRRQRGRRHLAGRVRRAGHAPARPGWWSPVRTRRGESSGLPAPTMGSTGCRAGHGVPRWMAGRQRWTSLRSTRSARAACPCEVVRTPRGAPIAGRPVSLTAIGVQAARRPVSPGGPLDRTVQQTACATTRSPRPAGLRSRLQVVELRGR